MNSCDYKYLGALDIGMICTKILSLSPVLVTLINFLPDAWRYLHA